MVKWPRKVQFTLINQMVTFYVWPWGWGVFLQKAEIPFTLCNSSRTPKPQERRGLELGNCGNPFLQKIFLTRPAGGSG